jgi:hypothetical protein
MAPQAAVTRSRIKRPARTTRLGLRGRNSWPGWGRSFRSSARTAVVTSGSEQTAGRSRLTWNRRFASGRRPGCESPREVRFSHTSANHSSRLPSLPLVARPPTGARSCRSMTTATSCNPRPTSCPRSTSTASDRRRTRGVEAPGTADWDAVCADERKTPPQGNARRFGEPHPDGRNDRSRSSRVVRQPEDRCRSAIGRVILPKPSSDRG